jgi:hypothetical protein
MNRAGNGFPRQLCYQQLFGKNLNGKRKNSTLRRFWNKPDQEIPSLAGQETE